MQQGGAIAWGIVPTSAMTGKESVEGLRSRLEAGIARLAGWGIDPQQTARQSILTPSCGLGGMAPEAAARALALLSGLASEMSGGRARGE